MAVQRTKPSSLPSEVLASARERAVQSRKQIEEVGRDGLLTPEEKADAAPFYFVLRNYIRQLKRAREAARLTLADISSRTGIAVESLSRLETGANTNPTWKTLGTYAVAVGYRPELTATSAASNQGEVPARPAMFANRFSNDTATSELPNSLANVMSDPEKIRIGDFIWSDPPAGFGFPQSRVFSVLCAPTDRHLIHIGGFNAVIFSKASEKFVDLVCIQEVDGGKFNVASFAFRVFSDLCETPLPDLSPLEIVQKVIDRFGLPVAIGFNRKKFFLEEDLAKSGLLVPGQDPSAVLHIDSHDKRGFILGCALKVESEVIRVALAFGLDAGEYKKWVDAHASGDQ